MKKLLFIICLFITASTKAQYVNIPDATFRSLLKTKYPGCFNAAQQMDTTCSSIINDTVINFYGTSIASIEGIQYFKHLKSLALPANSISFIPSFPNTIVTIYLSRNKLTSIPKLPDNLTVFDCSINLLTALPQLPNSLNQLLCGSNKIPDIPSLPNTIQTVDCSSNLLDSLPDLGGNLTSLNCSRNKLVKLPGLPSTLITLNCNDNKLTALTALPAGLITFNCARNQIQNISYLPKKIKSLILSKNNLTSIPDFPDSVKTVYIDSNNISSIPEIAFLKNMTTLSCKLNNIYCLPKLPSNLIFRYLYFDQSKIKCFPNKPDSLKTSSPPLCNPTNNINHCQSFAVIQSYVYYDNNFNGKPDINELPRKNIKLNLSSKYTHTNQQGSAQINPDSLGTYTITATPPPFYAAVPSSYTHTFNTYDTIVYDTFSLQPTVLKDSLAIKLTPIKWAARPGFKYPYLLQYENVGTTVLSNAVVSFHFNNNLLGYDSCSLAGAIAGSSTVSINVGNLVPGQTGNCMMYCHVISTDTLNTILISWASIAITTSSATDSIRSIIRGSYDPNDKQATPSLTTQQVSEGKYIDYTIRFQNTGNDTAFNVVIADTLDSKLQFNQVQMVGSSHSCKTTVKDNIIFFEFLDINLPDSHINKLGSNGFVSFKILPQNSLVAGNVVPNKAAIYFDYNTPVITAAATTTITYPLPLKLLNFSVLEKDQQQLLISWNTTNEINTSHFIIETTGSNNDFTSLAEIAAKGSGSNGYFYAAPKNNIRFVRLKMVDKNGSFTYSNIIKLGEVAGKKLEIVGNPARQYLQLKVPAGLHHSTARLIDAVGKTVKSFTLQQGYQNIDISNLTSGMYWLQCENEVVKVVVSQ